MKSDLTLNARTALVLCVAVAGTLAASAFHHVGTAADAAVPNGSAIFAAHCAACHQTGGLGGGPYPPLAGNPDVAGAATAALIATLLNGRSGPMTVLGKSYSGSMPGWKGQLSNAEIAGVLTYVRSAWTNKAAAVSEDQVASAAAPTALSGAALFAAKCAACHQAAGQGSSAFPPLTGNPDVTADDPKNLIATIVNGRNGPLAVHGKSYSGSMPAWRGQLSNSDIAAVATFVRSAWGNKASAVSEQQVAAAGPAVLSTVGASIYARRCLTCHAASGRGGDSGIFPALAGNAHVNATDPSVMLGTIENGKNIMPAWKGQLSAGDIAAVATYIRSAWGNRAAAVTEANVSAVK